MSDSFVSLACSVCRRSFLSKRRHARFCGGACRQFAHRARQREVLDEDPRYSPETAAREVRARLRVLRRQEGLPELAASRRLDLEAGLQASRVAVASFERLIDSAPPGPPYTTLVHRLEWLGRSEVQAAEFLGVGAARSAEGLPIVVIIVGASKRGVSSAGP